MTGKYDHLYEPSVRSGAGDARPTALQIVEDEKRAGDLAGKVVVVTGCSLGIGIPMAEAMAATGATVYCTARDLDRARAALGPLLDSPRVHLVHMDLTSLASVKAGAEAIRKRETQVNVLINNAGVMNIPQRELTEDGFERQMGTNHLAHFYLFAQLRDLLLAGSAAGLHSRVVCVSSSAHRACPTQLDDVNLERQAYRPWTAYGSSKTANVWMANQVERLYGARGIHGLSLMPGQIVTPLARYVPELAAQAQAGEFSSRLLMSPEQGAATSVWAALSRDLEGKGALYLENCGIPGPAPPLPYEGLAATDYGHAKWAFDQEGEERLWGLSLELTGLKE